MKKRSARVQKSTSTQDRSAPYPKPGEVGGRLIRKLIGFLRSQGVKLPLKQRQSLSSQILSGNGSSEIGRGGSVVLAVSGGSDSMAMALLLAKYGRKVVDRSQLEILHINHGWRGQQSESDARFVQDWARSAGVAFRGVRLRGKIRKGESLEAQGRDARLKVYRERVLRGAIILTAHTADDLAETVLWRLCTGKADSHAGGVEFQYRGQIRPLLFARKRELQAFLKEENQAWREDATNHQGRLLRSRMRQLLMPELEAIFPRSVEHLAEIALRFQRREQEI